jgi:excisionase family DNA binding protein
MTVVATTPQLDELLTMLDADTRLVDADGREIALGADVAEAFQAAIADMLAGDTDDLTTQQAARLIGVSRPTLIRLLDHGALTYRRTNGTRGHRRIARGDALAYLRADLQRRRHALDELAADAEAFGFFDN